MRARQTMADFERSRAAARTLVAAASAEDKRALDVASIDFGDRTRGLTRSELANLVAEVGGLPAALGFIGGRL